jgi:subtilisin family serine protease
MKRLILPAVLFIASFTSCKKDMNNQDNINTPPVATQAVDEAPGLMTGAKVEGYASNEILVKFKPGAAEGKRAEAFARVAGAVKEKVRTRMMEMAGEEGFYVVHTPLSVLDAISKIKGIDIEYAEPNYIYTYGSVSTDPYFTNGSLWGMNGTYGSNAYKAWANNHTGSTNVVVGIIDQGIEFSHPDLQGQVWTNPYDPVDGRDNDGNGYIDDVHGWDFDGNNNTIYDGGTTGSTDNHGTHVAGTIGAKANNSQGVAGVNWNITMISAKFIGANGGTTASAVKAIDYITDMKIRHGMNIVATNNSWGGGGYSQALYDAINRANNRNILFIAAAGNGGSDGIGDNNDVTPNYPSNYKLPNVIAVAAIASNGTLGSFSNYGKSTVHIGAPGVGIWSSLPYNTYGSYSGTSMATPHVTGGAALYASTHPGSTAAQIKSAILNSATPTTSLSGKTITGGRLNVGGF